MHLKQVKATGVKNECFVRRKPSSREHFNDPAELRKIFYRILNKTNRVNNQRAINAASEAISSNAHKVRTIYLGVQVSVEGANSFGHFLPAIDSAIDKVKKKLWFNGVTFKVVPILYLDWLACDALAILEQFNSGGVHVVFGPLNDFVVGTVARFSTAQYLIPIVSPAAFADTLGEKNEYAMLTRMFFTYTDLTWVLKVTLSYFGWLPGRNTPIGMITIQEMDTDKSYNAGYDYIFQKMAVVETLRTYNTLAKDPLPDPEKILHSLEDLPRHVRIVILCADPESVRQIMLIAHNLGYINGEYVFFTMNLLSGSKNQAQPWYRASSSAEENRRAREAYRVLMTITLRRPDSPEFLEFGEEVKRRARQHYGYTYASDEINPFIGAFHDAVILYTLALNRTLAAGGSIWNGTLLTQNMWNITFTGIVGNVTVDTNGDRNADYSLLDMNPETGIFEPVAHYFGHQKVYVPIADKAIDWANVENKPPPDTPVCGFDGTLCRGYNLMRIGIATTATIFFMMIVAIVGAIIIYKKARFHAELKAMNWIIPWDDLYCSTDRHFRRNHKNSGASNSQFTYANSAKRHEPVFTCGASVQLSDVVESQVLLTKEETTEPIFSAQVTARQLSNLESGSLAVSFNPDRPISKKKCSSFRGFFPLLNHRHHHHHKAIDTKVNSFSSRENGSKLTWWQERQKRWSRRGDAHTLNLINPPPDYSCELKLRSEAGKNTTEYNSRSKNKPFKHRHYFRNRNYPINMELTNKQGSDVSSKGSYSSLDTISGVHLNNMTSAQLFTKTALYKGNVVAFKEISQFHRIDLTKELLIEVKRVKDLNCEHICRFLGACIEAPNKCLVYEYCPKGSLHDVLENEQINLDWMFKFSLMQDICRGMTYLHHNLGPHGNLKSSNCLVDSRFVLKITDFSLHLLRGPKDISLEEDFYAFYRNLLWTAPELLRSTNLYTRSGTVKGDVYSFAIVCQEIVYRKGVFYVRDEMLEPNEIVDRVMLKSSNPFRPTLDIQESVSCELVRLITDAWNEEPQFRPDFTTIKVSMRKLNRSGDSGNLLDNLLSRMEQYANNLEELVAQRTTQYLEEKKKTEDLLYSMLPRSVAGQLIMKQPVTAESFEMVTIYFSDIVEFTALSAESTPMQVVELLNRLYTLFDSSIEKFDVYKVETIGDAYMVASGLPQRNETRHAREIALMAVDFVKSINRFKIPHRPEKQLKLRIGIHSGPVCAGVVGLKMPRYCLFGDTVNTSSRMENSGLPLKIHISHQTMTILLTFGSFIMSERGYVEMKGKGKQLTYWLHGEGKTIVDPPPPGARIISSSPDENIKSPRFENVHELEPTSDSGSLVPLNETSASDIREHIAKSNLATPNTPAAFGHVGVD